MRGEIKIASMLKKRTEERTYISNNTRRIRTGKQGQVERQVGIHRWKGTGKQVKKRSGIKTACKLGKKNQTANK